jgi:ParB family chromosome partitioning protein
MATTPQRITLSLSRDIPFNKLVLSQANVRRVKAGVSLEELAEDIARRGLLQGLSVRAVCDASGAETGLFEIPAGGRRYRALQLLVKQKRLARTAPVPCILRQGGIAEEDSLAENIQRAPLHPLDQFRAFLALKDKGQSEEEIAATFFVSVTVVKQRLRLAAVSPKLLDVYAEDGMTLEQLMAFTVCGDHARQEEVFERLGTAYDPQPQLIRRWLTEAAVRASDKRARFIDVDAYVAAGGTVLRDLFQGDDGGWLEDAALVNRMVTDKLRDAAGMVQAEGWKWVEVATDPAYGYAFGLRQLRGAPVPLTAEEAASQARLQAEHDDLLTAHGDAEQMPDAVDRRLAELEAAIAAIETRPLAFDVAEIARAGVFVWINPEGRLRIDRGYVRPEDELPVAAEDSAPAPSAATIDDDAGGTAAADPGGPPEPEEEDGGLLPLPDRLVTELTAWRTLALRRALSERPDIAGLAVLHALTLKVFYAHAQDSCLELQLRSVSVPAPADAPPARALGEQRRAWRAQLPNDAAALWQTLLGWDEDSRGALLAFVVAEAVNALIEPYNRRPRAIAHADGLAQALGLDLAAAGWTPTAETVFGRVSKARILAAVAEAKGEAAADRLRQLKKAEMAEQAEVLLAGSGWLPEPLRTPGLVAAAEPAGEPHSGPHGLEGDDDPAPADMAADAWPDDAGAAAAA